MDTNENKNNVYPKREDIEPQTKSDDFRPENNEKTNTNEPPKAPAKAD